MDFKNGRTLEKILKESKMEFKNNIALFKKLSMDIVSALYFMEY